MRGADWEELGQDYWEEQDNHDMILLGESEPFFWGNPDDSLRKVINQHPKRAAAPHEIHAVAHAVLRPGVAAAFGSSCW